MEGARWVQKEILEKYPGLNLKVYAVWIPMVVSDKFSRAGSHQLNDARVTHFWDGEKVVGKWFAEQFGFGGVAWDIYFLYDGKARWEDKIEPAPSWGSTVLGRRNELKKEVLTLEGIKTEGLVK